MYGNPKVISQLAEAYLDTLLPEWATAEDEAEESALPLKKRRLVVRPGQAPQEVAREPVKPRSLKLVKTAPLEPDEDDRETLGRKGGGLHGHLRRLSRNKDAHEEYFSWRSRNNLHEGTAADYAVSPEEAKKNRLARLHAIAKKLLPPEEVEKHAKQMDTAAGLAGVAEPKTPIFRRKRK